MISKRKLIQYRKEALQILMNCSSKDKDKHLSEVILTLTQTLIDQYLIAEVTQNQEKKV